MAVTVAAIYRHPVKGLGEEALERVAVTAGAPMPWDRVWAVTHGRSDFNPVEPEWSSSRNHVIQSTNPALAQMKCAFDDAAEAITLAHPALGEITVKPETEGERLTDWIAPIAGASGPPPYRIARAPGVQAMTDFPDTHFAIGNLASLRALEEMAGRPLDHIRFRMNIWIDGAAPWEEFDWEDRTITIGGARFAIIGRVKRCNATNADPATGKRDTDIPRLLHGRFRHMDFGVYAQATTGGDVALGDVVAV